MDYGLVIDSLVIVVLLFLVRVGPNQLNRGLSNIYLQFGMQISCVELLFKSFSGSKKKVRRPVHQSFASWLSFQFQATLFWLVAAMRSTVVSISEAFKMHLFTFTY